MGLNPVSNLPESGEAEFSLTFEPLSSSVQSFNFTEGTEKNDWQINRVRLNK